MASFINGNLYTAAGEKVGQAWSDRAKTLHDEWRGKGQFVISPIAKLFFSRTPWTSASHKGGEGPDAYYAEMAQRRVEEKRKKAKVQ